MILAISAAEAAIPVKPNTPATKATIKNINTHINIAITLTYQISLLKNILVTRVPMVKGL